eukprot:CAMPEP_0114636566 /NCGR_PEP_ID=MMETSP0168-20121206/17052_1 /TAXON_ID=95228 ORGANISM="Vannella sp., Strain DIVA3 517/6/12" /NCGR_SAMPLE_ID=MMETSP0168 /ASSEMBLY_ACC=CAM_ASM_000044 /LENGTH=1272 /DNA_ID=CAMNT_0001848283 /DNA_START=143 /DNA_END=3962 /DNA_ORIENTATION=+
MSDTDDVAMTEAEASQLKRKREAGSEKPPAKKIRKGKELRNDVRFTGARVGDVIVGINEGQTKGVRLKVVDGETFVCGKAVEKFGEEAVVEAYAKWYRLSKARARQLLMDRERDSHATHHALGQACNCDPKRAAVCPHDPGMRFVIVEPGQLQVSAGLVGQTEVDALEAMVAEQRVASWKDVLQLMGKKTLAMQRGWYRVQGYPRVVDTPDEEHTIIDTTAVETETQRDSGAKQWVYLGDDLTVRVSGGGLQQITAEEAHDVVCEQLPILQAALTATYKEENDSAAPTLTATQVTTAMTALAPLSIGALKSTLQKTIRFAALHVQLPKAGEDAPDACTVPSCIMAACTAALLFSKTGCFVPDLQMFTRGCVGALKRLFVILLEDCWLEGAPLQELAAAALVLQRCPDMQPGPGLIAMAVVTSGKAALSSAFWNWREVGGSSTCSKREIPVSIEEMAKIGQAARILRLLRSFGGDMDMADKVAAQARRGRAPLLRCKWAARPERMPLEHMVDQHAFRGIGHCVRPGVGEEFSTIFRAVFHEVTGVNPRWATDFDKEGFEKETVVSRVRFGQKVILGRALKTPLTELPTIGERQIQLTLDRGVLQQLLGQGGKGGKATGKRTLIVTLGTQDAGDEMVMKKPTRNTADLYDDIVPEEREAAIAAVRAQAHTLSTPYPIGKVAKFENGEWTVDGKSWEAIVGGSDEDDGAMEGGLTVTVPLHPDPVREWKGDKDRGYLRVALAFKGAGMAEHTEDLLRNICRITPQQVRSRALALLQQQYRQVAMPTPALNGSIGHDQLMAYACDPAVWRFLVALSLLVPGALLPEQVPKFSVPNPMLLRVLVGWLCNAPCQDSEEERGSKADGIERWSKFQVDEGVLMQHQADAVFDMLQRDKQGTPGHFVVLDVGLGKTLLTAAYIRHFLNETTLDIRAVLWVTPSDLVQPTLEQLRQRWKLPACILGSAAVPKRGSINLVAHDHLRKRFTKQQQRSQGGAASVVEELAAWAPFMVVVLDEVDTMYANTQRTSAAHRISALAAKLVCQTATPLRNSRHEQLAAWLARTENYPVEKSNWLVAANSMVSKQIDLSIEVEYREEVVPMSQEVRSRHLAVGRDWAAMARLTQDATDEKMAAVAAAAALEHGGVLVVANDEAHVAALVELLQRQAGVRAGTFEDRGDEAFNAVVVSKRHCRGYNEATRLGAIVTGVYAGNGADRHQMTGRLKRIGQRRSRIFHVTVYMQHSILELLHQRHQSVDTMNLSLEALGDKYGVEVLRHLQDSA